jgi:ATP-dependent helicase YprA (DUF1998 family)
VGFARRIFHQWEDIRTAALAHVQRCPCRHGCPSCVGAVVETGDRARAGATWLLTRAAGAVAQAAPASLPIASPRADGLSPN